MGKRISADISSRQRQILQFICEFRATRGISPSYREIRAELKLNSIATVSVHIEKLARYGYITPPRGKHRALAPKERYL